MSKFEYGIFYGGYDTLAVSKEKYTKEQATEIAKQELEGMEKPYYIGIGNGYVRHRAGINEDNERCVGWWIEYIEHKRSCPCYVFHSTNNPEKMTFNKEYEYIKVE